MILSRLASAGIAATALTSVLAPAAPASASPDCTNGVVPLNPYVVNCNLPPRGNQVMGGAPDAGAIIACRHSPICLSYYVNYPGTLIVPGYRP
ncbi:hypothetical protein [Mycobacterium sp. EPa45]|uniref:hypothetical protein n=1 Tax=Mycobacterium sp. EPa45 TaxID=1545728 RepID=UPI0006423B39|nr:hypothetical protein [Mycobacterium sp. EPa45]AKK28009.1 hypothetical protein AB431_16455 [Mycobacterium sp. EPa45]